jgi:hypothetical protein
MGPKLNEQALRNLTQVNMHAEPSSAADSPPSQAQQARTRRPRRQPLPARGGARPLFETAADRNYLSTNSLGVTK